jgi:IclR family acetate operon transcriptional repressor
MAAASACPGQRPFVRRVAGFERLAWHSVNVSASPTQAAPSTASPVESIDRALLTLTTLASAGTAGLSLGQLADRVGINRATLHRTLAALRFRDFVAQDVESGNYRLGAAAITLADAYFAGDRLTAALHPALVALARDVDELVHLGVLAGAQIVYLDKVEPERPVRVWSAVGRRAPAATTALGRALLIDRASTKAALVPYVEGLTNAAHPAAVSVDRVWQVLSDARRLGYTYEHEENEPGIACVAVPLMRAGSTIAAVSVTAPLERIAGERMGQVAQRMRDVLPTLLPEGIEVYPLR